MWFLVRARCVALRKRWICIDQIPAEFGEHLQILAKTMPLACWPPALLLSYRDGLLRHAEHAKAGCFFM
jgi:hypothetical protein